MNAIAKSSKSASNILLRIINRLVIDVKVVKTRNFIKNPRFLFPIQVPTQGQW